MINNYSGTCSICCVEVGLLGLPGKKSICEYDRYDGHLAEISLFQVSLTNKLLIPMYWFKSFWFGRDISKF